MGRARFAWRSAWSLWGASLASVFVVACSSSSGSTLSAGGSGTSSSAAQSAGQGFVTTRGCPRCHDSANGAFMAGQATPLPGYPTGIDLYGPNLTPDPETGIGTWSDDQLRLAIRFGVDNQGMNLCPQMEHYKTMGDDEVTAIIAFLRSIPAVKNKAPSSVCPPLKTRS